MPRLGVMLLRSLTHIGLLGAALLGGCAVGRGGGSAPAPPPRLTGSPTPIHDPSIIAADGWHYVFNTGRGVPIWRSRDLQTWRRAGRAFESDVPAWAAEVAPSAVDQWAPDVSRIGDRFVLAYAVSRFGTNDSAIGIAVSDSIDPKTAAWRDLGLVVRSAKEDNFNAIDPQVLSTRDGRVFLALGSMWDGIFLRELNPRSLRPLKEELIGPIAARPNGDTIEAAFLVERGKYWYLFVSFDACCRGSKSTYNIRVGRAERLKGPYVDREGVPMTEGGGTPLLSGSGPEIGTGHCSVIRDGDDWLLAYHYYDPAAAGRPTLGIRDLHWDKDGWPRVGRPLIEPRQNAPILAESDSG